MVAIPLLLSITYLGFAYVGTEKLGSTIEPLIERDLPALQMLQEMESSIHASALEIIGGRDVEAQRELVRLEKSIQDFNALFTDPESLTSLDRVRETHHQLLQMIRKGAAAERSYSTVRATLAPGEEAVERLAEQASNRSAASRSNFKQNASSNISIAFALAVLAGTEAFLLGIWLRKTTLSAIQGVSSQLANVSVDLVASSRRLDEMSMNLAAASTEASASLLSSRESMAVMDRTLARNHEEALRTGEASQRSRESAQKGAKSVEAVMESVGQIYESSKTLQDLEGIIRAIRNQTKIIDEIVMKTRLLAVNAAIEAARAGNAGSSFAVVADEVGELAERSGQASSEISTLISGSIERVQQIVDELRLRIEAGRRAGMASGHAIREVLGQASQVDQAFKSVIVHSKEQAEGLRELYQSAQQLGDMVDSNSEVARQVTEAAAALRRQADWFGAEIERLQQLVGEKSEARIP